MRTLTFQSLDSYLNAAPLFRKVAIVRTSDIEVITLDTEREIETIVGGMMETKRLAKVGDVILTGPKGEKYVSSKKSFDALHTQDLNDPEVYYAKHVVRAVLLEEDFVIRASWGEDMVISSGGVAVLRLNDNKFYGNQADTFNETYWRVSPSGKDLCPLTLPLEDQMRITEEQGAIQHKRDVMARMALQKYPHRPSYVPKVGLMQDVIQIKQ